MHMVHREPPLGCLTQSLRFCSNQPGAMSSTYGSFFLSQLGEPMELL